MCGRKHRRSERPNLQGFATSMRGILKSAQRNYERYLLLAHAEALTGDRITAENYFQHAEHYFRSMH